MKVLGVERAFPEGAVAGTPSYPVMTVKVYFTGSLGERYLCNPKNEVDAAIAAGESFVAHQLRGMEAVELTVNPHYVTGVEAL